MIRNTIFVLLLLAVNASASETESEKYHVVSNTKELMSAVKEINSGETIILRPGTYEIEETLVFENKSLINIIGSGWNTNIYRKGDGDAIVFKNAGFCRVKDLMITGDREAEKGSGIVFEGNSSSCVVDFCRICLFPESGVRFNGDGESPQSSNTVRDSHFVNNTGHQLWSYRNNDFYIIGNQFGADRWGRGENPKTGCLLDNSSAGTYSKNYHWGNVNGFKMVSSNFNRIENNRFEESKESGIVIGDTNKWSGGGYNIILGNTIHTNSQGNFGEFPAVIARNASFFQFCSNQILSWDFGSTMHKHGLVLEKDCNKWIVKDNIIHHSTKEAIVYEEDAGHIVKDNIID